MKELKLDDMTLYGGDGTADCVTIDTDPNMYQEYTPPDVEIYKDDAIKIIQFLKEQFKL